MNTIRKHVSVIGDGNLTELLVQHNLETQDVIASVKLTETGEFVIADIVCTSQNIVTVIFAIPPKKDEYTVVIIG